MKIIKEKISKLDNSLKAAGIFTILNFLPSAINFFLLPIYLKYLEVSEYGLLAILAIFSGLYAVFANAQLNIAASVNYFDYNEDVNELKKFKTTIFTASFLFSLATYIIFLVLGPFILNLFLTEETVDFYPYGFIVITSGFLAQIYSVYFIYLKNEYTLKEFTYYSLSLIFINIGFQYYLIVIVGLGALGSILGGLISKVLVTTVFIVKQRQLFQFKIDKDILKEALRFCLPVLPIVFINWLLRVSDKVFLGQFLDLTEVGKYSLLINLILLATLVFGAWINAFRPTVFGYFKDLNPYHITKFQQFVGWHIKVGLFTLSGVILVGSNLNLITENEKYIAIIPLFTLGCLTMVPRLLLGIPNLQLMFKKQSKIISIYAIISLVILVIGFLILIPKYRLEGALYSLGIANTVNLILLYIKSQQHLKVSVEFIKNSSIVLISLVLVGGLFFLCQHFQYSSNVYGLLQFGAIMIFILVLSSKDVMAKFTFTSKD